MSTVIESIAEVTSTALSSVVSSLIGVNLKDIQKAFTKGQIENLEISESIDIVSQKLEDSKAIIDNALIEIDKQKKLFEQMKSEAEISQQIASLNEDQVAALNILLAKTLNTQDRKALPKAILLNLFFCILSAVLGFLLGKFLQ